MRKRLYLINFILALAWGGLLTMSTYFFAGARGEALASAFSSLGPFFSALLFTFPPFVVMLFLPRSMTELKGGKGMRFFFASLLSFLLGAGIVVVFWVTTFVAAFSRANLAW